MQVEAQEQAGNHRGVEWGGGVNRKHYHEVKAGQTWQDCDRRMNGRCVYVNRIEGEYAYCRVGATRKTTRLLLRRMRPGSTGWRLVRDENGKRVEE